MDGSEFLTVVMASVVGSLGGGGLVGKIIISKHTERLRHEFQIQIERYKTKLNKSEFLFQKEFEAAAEFISLRRSIMPKYRHPDMIWDEACEEIARDFATIKEDHLASHGPALEPGTFCRLIRIISEVDAGKFEITTQGVTEQGMHTADKT